MKKLWSFIASDDGAVTVDWVVLTAALAGFAALIATQMEDGAMGLANALLAYMSNWSFS